MDSQGNILQETSKPTIYILRTGHPKGRQVSIPMKEKIKLMKLTNEQAQEFSKLSIKKRRRIYAEWLAKKKYEENHNI